MARIRSVHPGIWTDERFVSVSAQARLLWIGLWSECDDEGAFDWSPLKIKMRLAPADNWDMVPLLEELEAAGLVKSYELGGRQYGAVRNFCRFQKPKKPNSIHVKPPEVRNFVGLKSDEFGTGTEKSRQMEEEGENPPPISPPLSVKDKIKKLKKPNGLSQEAWDSWVDYRVEKRKALSMSTAKKQLEKLGRWAEEGQCPDQIINQSIEQGWQGLFTVKDADAPPTPAATAASPPIEDASPAEWVGRLEAWAQGRWSRRWGPKPDQAGCLCPRDVLRKAGVVTVDDLVSHSETIR